MNNIYDDLYQVGQVIKIKGTLIEVEATKQRNSKMINYNGELLKNIHVFGKVIVKSGYTFMVVDVIGEYTNINDFEKKRFFSGKVVGTIVENKYVVGIENIPIIGNDVFLINSFFSRIIAPTNEDNISLGQRLFNKNLSLNINTNKFYGSHIGIFGNTGSGKSYTLAKIMEIYFDKFGNLKGDLNFIFDLTGEYKKTSFSDNIKIVEFSEKADSTKVSIHINIDSLCILLSASEGTQRPFLKKTYSKLGNNTLNWMEIIPKLIVSGNEYLNDELMDILPDYLSEWIASFNTIYHYGTIILTKDDIEIGKSTNPSTLENIIKKIYPTLGICFVNGVLGLNYLDRLYIQILYEASVYRNPEFIMPLIERFSVIRKEINQFVVFTFDEVKIPDYNVILYDLSMVSEEYKKILSTLLIGQWYSMRNKDKYFMKFIIDEAHNLLSNSNNEINFSDYRISLIKKILKEGRKYNVFAYLASQRPGEIDQTVISQLHNYFFHSIKNSNDLNIIEKCIPFIDDEKMNVIPGLPRGVAYFSGLASEDNDIISIFEIKNEINVPNSHNIDIMSFSKQDLE